MEKWTEDDVAERFEEAVRVLKRLPSVKVQGYFNTWPNIDRTPMEKLQGDKLPTRLGPPPPDAISRMEETLEWVFWLDTEDERRLIWLRAAHVRWKKIQWHIGCGRTKAWHLWRFALLKIATRLNVQ